MQVDGGGSSVAPSFPFARSPPKEEPVEAKGAQQPETADLEPASDEKTTSKPVAIRWDSASPLPSGHCKLLFPLSANDAGTGKARLEALLRDCQPATFGRGSEDILDETYRKASKLDSSAFSTDFCPYTLGIVDTAAELLMPGVGIGLARTVKAELYKLNVRSCAVPILVGTGEC